MSTPSRWQRHWPKLVIGLLFLTAIVLLILIVKDWTGSLSPASRSATPRVVVPAPERIPVVPEQATELAPPEAASPEPGPTEVWRDELAPPVSPSAPDPASSPSAVVPGRDQPADHASARPTATSRITMPARPGPAPRVASPRLVPAAPAAPASTRREPDLPTVDDPTETATSPAPAGRPGGRPAAKAETRGAPTVVIPILGEEAVEEQVVPRSPMLQQPELPVVE